MALSFTEQLTKPSAGLAITRGPIRSYIGRTAAFFFDGFPTSSGIGSTATPLSSLPAYTEDATRGRSALVSEKASNTALHRTPSATPPSPLSFETFGDRRQA